MEQQLETLKNDLFLKLLKEQLTLETVKNKPTATLVGGAVIDILRGVRPKDYDLLYNSTLEKAMKDNPAFKLEYVSKSAITFSINGFIIQLLHKDVSTFPYTIEQSRYDVISETLTHFDKQSFDHRVLVPTRDAFSDKFKARCAITRLLHHQAKGWNLPNITFQSLCNVAFKSEKSES